ncbi:unnamed protein product, partial [Owenia fusiformis]
MTSSDETNKITCLEEEKLQITSSDEINSMEHQQIDSHSKFEHLRDRHWSDCLSFRNDLGNNNDPTKMIKDTNATKFPPDVIVENTSKDVTNDDLTEQDTHPVSADFIKSQGNREENVNIKVEPDQVNGLEDEHDNVDDTNRVDNQVKQDIKHELQNCQSFAHFDNTADENTETIDENSETMNQKNPTVSLCRLSEADIKLLKSRKYTSKRRICSLMSKTQPTLNQDHKGERLFRCNICYEAFYEISNLSKHIAGHLKQAKSSVKAFKCN